MPLDPDVASFLELVELGRLTGKSVPMHQLSVEQARAEFETSARILDPEPPQDVQVVGCLIPTRDGQTIEARLYRSAIDNEHKRPAILYFHGGGYVVGSLDSHDCVCRRLAQATGYAVLAPAYRLAPEYRFPTALEDAQDAADWLLDCAQQLDLDAQRIIVGGDSAGATLATLLTMTSGQDSAASGRTKFTASAQLLFYPVTDASAVYPSFQEFDEGYLLESQTMEWFYRHYLGSGEQRKDWRVSPLLTPPGKDLVPAYIRMAEYDPLRDEGLRYAEFLQGRGGRVDVSVESGLTHDFLRMSGVTDRVDGIYRNAADWLNSI